MNINVLINNKKQRLIKTLTGERKIECECVIIIKGK